MGYTHYYYVRPEYDQDLFLQVATDFKKMIPVMGHLGVKLGDYHGENTPIIRPDEIGFNGFRECGHQERDLGITWPSQNAQGMSKNSVQTQLEELVNGQWFAGFQLETRACGGDCSHETFLLEQKKPIEQWQNAENGYIFECTKTAYKPYDLAVNVALIIAKHYLKDDILIRSDGEIQHWEEAKQLCQHFLGYGEKFQLDTKNPKDMPKQEETELYRKFTYNGIKYIDLTDDQLRTLKKSLNSLMGSGIGDDDSIKQTKIYAIDELLQKRLINTPVDESKISVGDIFVRSWGYDQTNVDYVKVISITKSGKSAKVQKIASKHVKSLSDMSGEVMPDPETPYKVDPKMYRIKRYSDKIYLGYYRKWDGKPDFTSSWA